LPLKLIVCSVCRRHTEKVPAERPLVRSDGQPVASDSLADTAYLRLREAILQGELRPNQRLVEAELAEWLQLSRTPLREGLSRLASEGLVATRRRGWVVREFTPQEVAEVHEVRAALEGMAVFLAAERASDDQIASIVEFHSAQNQEALAAQPGNYLVEYNDAFHTAIVDMCDNERLRYFIRINRDFFFTYRIAKLYSENEARRSLAGHDEIIDALRERDGERGERAMREHILEARDAILQKLY
jgi:DNA-binding GntR family transcriptional regulator